MKNCLMYKLSYYRVWHVESAPGKPKGWDTVRNYMIGYKNYKLYYFREAFSSEKWIVRIFKRRERNPREAVEIFKEGEYKKFMVSNELPGEIAKTYKYAVKKRTA